MPRRQRGFSSSSELSFDPFRCRQNVSATLDVVAVAAGPCREPAMSRSSDFCPKRRNSTGVSSVSSSVALIRPPKIVTATGCRISLPGVAASISSGSSATPAASAVISTGVSRSRLPRTTSSRPNGSPSSQRQIDVVADLEDAVARGDAGQA